MAPGTEQLLKLLMGVISLGLLAGCGAYGALGGAAFQGAFMGIPFYEPKRKQCRPEVVCTADDSIGIRAGCYWSWEELTESRWIISEHCGGSYVETQQVTYYMPGVLVAVCLQEDGSAPDAPSCKDVGPEQTPVGFDNTDPSIDFR